MCPRRLRQSVGVSLQKGLPVSLCLCKLMFVVLEKHLAYNTLAADWLKNIWKHVCEPPVRQNSVQIIKYCHLARLFSTAWCIYLLGRDLFVYTYVMWMHLVLDKWFSSHIIFFITVGDLVPSQG